MLMCESILCQPFCIGLSIQLFWHEVCLEQIQCCVGKSDMHICSIRMDLWVHNGKPMNYCQKKQVSH